MRSRSLFDDLAFFTLTLLLLSFGCATPMTSMVDGVNSRSRGNVFSKSKDVLPKDRRSLKRDVPASRRKVDIKGQQVDPAFLDRLKESKTESGSETGQFGKMDHHVASKHIMSGPNSTSSQLGVIPEVKMEGRRTKGSKVAFKFSDNSLAQLSALGTNSEKVEVDSQRGDGEKIRITVQSDSTNLSLSSDGLSAGSMAFQSAALAPDSLKGPYSIRTREGSGSSGSNSKVKASSARLKGKFQSTAPMKVVKTSSSSPERISVKGYLTDQGNNIRAIIDTGSNQTEIITVGSRLAIGEESELEIFEVEAIDSAVHLQNILTKQRLIVK
jgi:hypothetical protein